MWISRKEFDALKDEVASLKRLHEAHVRDVVEDRNFRVYEPRALRLSMSYPSSLYNLNSIPEQSMSLKTVVERILDKLGMELVYVEGRPASIDMQKKPKA